MAQKIQKVYAKSADGSERLLALVRLSGPLAFVCPLSKAQTDAEANEWAVGFPIDDVRNAEETLN